MPDAPQVPAPAAEDRVVDDLLPECCGQYGKTQMWYCGRCPCDDALASYVGNPAQRRIILTRLASLRAEVRDLTGICRHLAADRDALAQRVGEVEKVVAAAQRWYDGDDTVLAEAVQAYRAALAGRKVRPAGAEQREGA